MDIGQLGGMGMFLLSGIRAEEMLYNLAKEGIAWVIVLALFIIALVIIKVYPGWQDRANQHEVKLKELEFTKEEKVAKIFDSALDKQSELIARGNELTSTLIKQINGNTSIMERIVTVTERTDRRCEEHGRRLEEIAFCAGVRKDPGKMENGQWRMENWGK